MRCVCSLPADSIRLPSLAVYIVSRCAVSILFVIRGCDPRFLRWLARHHMPVISLLISPALYAGMWCSVRAISMSAFLLCPVLGASDPRLSFFLSAGLNPAVYFSAFSTSPWRIVSSAVSPSLSRYTVITLYRFQKNLTFFTIYLHISKIITTFVPAKVSWGISSSIFYFSSPLYSQNYIMAQMCAN